MKNCLSTTEVSRQFGVDPKTIYRWLGRGFLEGTKIGQRHVVTRKSVTALAHRCGLPNHGDGIVAMVGAGVGSWLGKDSRITLVSSWFELGRLLGDWRPEALVIDLSLGRQLAVDAVRLLRRDRDRPCVVALCHDDEEGLKHNDLWDRKITPPWSKLRKELSECKRIWNR